ncbi:uncharacterized protein LOC121369354 isoform X2 [Gigantopelta aegis]|uniref:uncharacterized protein LOC121369354 isoform X2 n=1 Tax=Gigantopelta aegis TaxID=1735272 RepID=UPI001B88CAD4|nr:uncharacterized protein LOC121369354 isoform X2 [Gigantopelta aegis]
MALVTIQRSPSPSNDPDADDPDGAEEGASGRSPLRNRSLSESYFTVKGTALILPQSECARKTSKKSHGGDIQQHLQSMLYLLRHEDRIKVAVKLEQTGQGHQRYLALVSTVGRQDTEESVILGIDYTDRASVGLVLPLWAGTKIKLNGDGGFSVSVDDKIYLFKPVSVQAMWSALQCVQKAVSLAEEQRYIPGGLTHTWVEYYNAKMDRSDCTLFRQWRVMEGIEIFGPNAVTDSDDDNKAMQLKISASLKEVMMSVDLDEATSKSLRTAVEEKLGMSLSDYRSYFDSEMIRILGQMDSPTMILDFLFLGSEWNASNLEELRSNGIGYILNVTREIDNFYTGILSYMNVRVYDEPESELLKHWEKTYKYINKARKHGSKVLVHCKMGISRSASTVIAYLMKENRWSLEKALEFVQEKRGVINPNSGFREQLTTYEGMLKASDQRHVFHSTEPSLGNVDEEDEEVPPANEDIFLGGGLFHSSPDWPHDELASEEEILRRLKLEKGQGDNDDVMMEADLETGSRSTDSLEESLPDIPSPTPDQDLKKKTTSSGEYHFQPDLTGCFIVSGAVAGSEPAVMDESSDGSTDDELMDCGEDTREETAAGSEVPVIVEPVRELLFVDTSAGQSRIKPDNSWIKLDIDTSESTDDPAAGEDQQDASKPVFRISDDAESPVADVSHPETYLSQAVVPNLVRPTDKSELTAAAESVTDSPHDHVALDATETVSEPISDVDEVTLHADDVRESGVDDETCTSSLLDRQMELGVKQYYAQEQIPWFPGTVQKIKQEICKSTVACQPCDGAVVDGAHFEGSLESESEVLVSAYVTAVNTQELHTSRSCVELHTMEGMERPAKRRRRPVSVYEKEEIPLQQGLVRKTTLEIEEKHRLFSGEADRILFGDMKPIQRSASLKEERSSSKSRRSERRKTCGPIMSPPMLKSQPDFRVDDTHQQQIATADLCVDTCLNVNAVESAPVCDSETVVEDKILMRSEDVQCERESDMECGKSEEFLVRYGDELVPLVKGKVKKQTQDFESMTETEKSDLLTSSEHKEPSCSVDGDATCSTVSDVSASHNIPRTVSCDKQPSVGMSKLTDRWISVMDDKSKPEQPNVTNCISKPSSAKATKENSPFNDETLALIREIGSVLVNSPAKSASDDAEAEKLECSNVKMVVRQIEKQQGQNVKKHHREIIIIEDTSSKNSSSSSSARSADSRDRGGSVENCSFTKAPSIVQSAGSVFGLQGFHSTDTAQQIKNRTVEVSGNKDDVYHPNPHLQRGKDSGVVSSNSSDSGSADRRNLCLNLSGDPGLRTEAEKRLSQDEVLVDDVVQAPRVQSPGSSPRSDSDHSVVRHLVGRFEKDVKSPVLEKVEFVTAGKASSESPTSKDAAATDNTGSISTESLSFQTRKDSLKSSTMYRSGPKSSEKTSPRLTRPKSADHAESRQCKSSVEQLRLKRQGNVTQWLPEGTEVHQFGQQVEPDECRKVRCLQGKSHPLTKLNSRLGSNPFYNTM